jgi:hypothetical protein
MEVFLRDKQQRKNGRYDYTMQEFGLDGLNKVEQFVKHGDF